MPDPREARRRAMARPVVALVTAYNEAPTIGPVLDAVLACPLVTRVQVIDDASEDETAAVARSRPGVRVISLPQRVPVGDALLSHLTHVEEPDAIIFFCDADLLRLRPSHVEAIVRPVLEGEVGMAVGLKDKGLGKAVEVLTRDILPSLGFLIGGERALLREIADAVLGAPDAAGYGIHTLMNRFCGRYDIPVKVVFMDGCDHRQKFQKWGPWDAAKGMFHLLTQVGRTWLKTVLVPSRIPPLTFETPQFGRTRMTASSRPGEVEG
jgi:glycosyltransferase involved in cell wall biosynthesis